MQNQSFQLFSLSGKTAIVTGGMGLIGKKHCEALSQVGANVIVADISLKLTQEFAETLGENALGSALDVTDSVSLEKAKNEIL